MILKEYQKQTLTTLRAYLELCRLCGPKEAYKQITEEEEQKRRLGKYAQEYKELEGLPNVPYVCLRLPTGWRQDDFGRPVCSYCPRCLGRKGLSDCPLARSDEHDTQADC